MKRKDGQSLVYILAVLLAVNLIGFWQCYSDKRRAKKKRWRIPEKAGALVFGQGCIYSGIKRSIGIL